MSGRPKDEMDRIGFRIWEADIERARKRGLPISPLVAEAAEHIGVSERTAWRWAAREPTERPKTVFDPKHNKLVRLAGGNVAGAYRRAQQDQDAPFTKSLSTFRRALHDLGPVVEAGLRGGMKAAKKKQVYLKMDVTHRNQRWEIDHTIAPCWVIHPLTGRLCRPWMTLVIDCYSGVLVGFAFTVAEKGSADTSSILAAVGAAIRRYGAPEELVYDQGADFVGNAFTRALHRLKVAAVPVGADAGEEKPFVESANRVVKQAFFPMRPGFFIPRKSVAS